MKKLEIANPQAILVAINQEIGRSDDARYSHRLHVLFLLANGESCQQVAEFFGEDRRTLQRWVKRYETHGVDGLREGKHLGRPTTLSDAQWKKLRRELLRRPMAVGNKRPFAWNGKLLAEHLLKNYRVVLGLRHCQRVLSQMRLSWRA
jgi:transposase